LPLKNSCLARPATEHDLGNSHASEVARLIDEHLFLYA
jgi:hypothetical protein